MRQYKFMDFDMHDSIEGVISDVQDNFTYNETVRLFRDEDGKQIDEWLSLDIDEDTQKVFTK